MHSGEELTLSDQRASTLFGWSILAITVIQILSIALTPLGLAPDEAHYWEWSRRLDWSYYSKGPLIAVVIKAGTALFGTTQFGVRFPAVFFMVVTLSVLWKTLRLVAPPRIAFPVWLSGLSMILILQSGLVITTDSPCAACWITAVYAALRAMEQPK